eukprot:gnl/Spiro4/23096_TR11420_c0_g1_i1.p1 gnl/Spiro4/23096_TR11420_c0_g1~~gnl/Spiro4/23096_TR11420_c0_g1_i1.p1  ORF type:complete len:521 (+),score=169.17 gnl/Spiro4/23096_TR11420_c0_g1_i1:82-1563(+)
MHLSSVRPSGRAQNTQEKSRIMKNLQREDFRLHVERLNKQDNMYGEVARWEHRAIQKANADDFMARFNRLKEQANRNLLSRRQKLRELLGAEKESYSAAMLALQETVEERRDRMLLHAKLLHEEGERERANTARGLMHRRWREGCDELRGRDTRLNNYRVRDDRDAQLREQAASRQVEREREAKLDAMWLHDYQAKQNRHQLERARKKELDADMTAGLDYQRREHELQAEADEAERAEEAALLTAQWDLDNLQAQRREAERRVAMAEKRMTLDNFNKSQRAVRAAARAEERAQDLALIKAYVDAETEKDLRESADRARIREEANRYRQYLLEQMRKDEDFERRLDNMRKAQQDQEFAKEQERWDREAAARKRLMDEVINVRKIQIDEKLAAKRKKNEGQEVLRNRMIAQNEFYAEQDRAAAAATRQANVRVQHGQLQQVAEKNLQVLEQERLKERERVETERALRERKWMIDEELRRGGLSRTFARKAAQWTY